MERVIFGLAVFPKNIKCSAVKYQDVIVPTRFKKSPTFWVLEDDRGIVVDILPVESHDLASARRKVLQQVNVVFDAAEEAYAPKAPKDTSKKTLDWLIRWFRRK